MEHRLVMVVTKFYEYAVQAYLTSFPENLFYQKLHPIQQGFPDDIEASGILGFVESAHILGIKFLLLSHVLRYTVLQYVIVQ